MKFEIPLLGLAFVASICVLNAAANDAVQLVETPQGGRQPKLVVDDMQGVHLIYYQGDPQGGDLFYCYRPRGGLFSQPLRVNDVANSAVCMGTIRGAQLAVDPSRTVHVVWNGSRKVTHASSHPPMYYARLTKDLNSFTPQQPISGPWLVDGGGAVAVDHSSRVFVFWHSAPPGSHAEDRQVYMSVSNDSGKTFGDGRAIGASGRGVCPCCSMQATVDEKGTLYVVYRAADKNIQRDIDLLVSKDAGASFKHLTLDRWRLDACPMSSMAFCETENSMLVGWETEGQIRFTSVAKGTAQAGPIVSPPGGAQGGKHPVFAATPQGGFLLAWTEGTGWAKGGSVAWQAYDAAMLPLGDAQRLPAGVPVWSFAAAYYDQAQRVFRLLH